MSKSFSRPDNPKRIINQVALTSRLSFKRSTDYVPKIDYHLGTRQEKAFLRRNKAKKRPTAIEFWESNEEFRIQKLNNPWARAFQRKGLSSSSAEVTINPNNKFKPMVAWPTLTGDDEKITSFHEKYEYPLIGVNPLILWTERHARPTSTLWRQPNSRTWIERGFEHPHDPHEYFEGLTYCILRVPIEDLGAKGDIVAVHPDQFRNDLHPNRLAVVATRENCTLLGVAYDTLYQDHETRIQHGKLMERQPWVWDQLQGIPWEDFTKKPLTEQSSKRDDPWDGEVDRPIFAAETVAKNKALASDRRQEKYDFSLISLCYFIHHGSYSSGPPFHCKQTPTTTTKQQQTDKQRATKWRREKLVPAYSCSILIISLSVRMLRRITDNDIREFFIKMSPSSVLKRFLLFYYCIAHLSQKSVFFLL